MQTAAQYPVVVGYVEVVHTCAQGAKRKRVNRGQANVRCRQARCQCVRVCRHAAPVDPPRTERDLILCEFDAHAAIQGAIARGWHAQFGAGFEGQRLAFIAQSHVLLPGLNVGQGVPHAAGLDLHDICATLVAPPVIDRGGAALNVRRIAGAAEAQCGAGAQLARRQLQSLQCICVVGDIGKYRTVKRSRLIVASAPSMHVCKPDIGLIDQLALRQALIRRDGFLQPSSPCQTVGDNQLQFVVRLFFCNQRQPFGADRPIVSRGIEVDDALLLWSARWHGHARGFVFWCASWRDVPERCNQHAPRVGRRRALRVKRHIW